MPVRVAGVLLTALLITACQAPSQTTRPTPSPSRLVTPGPTPNPSVTGPVTLSAIQRLDSQIGYIAGWEGSGLGLAKTSDAGVHWQRLGVPTSSITALRFIDEQTGWVAGFIDRGAAGPPCDQSSTTLPPCRAVVLRTQDGGQSWQTVLAIPSDPYQGDFAVQLQAVDGQRAWALTIDPAACQARCLAFLRRTTDGGATWTTSLHAPVESMRFASANRGWVALYDPTGSEGAEVRMTGDGGTSWQSTLHASDGSPWSLDAATVSTAWFLTRNGAYCSSSSCSKYSLYRTDNGGLTWTYLDNPHDSACSPGHLAGPLFASTARGWFGLNLGAGGVSATGGTMRTDDGGHTWTCTTSPPNIGLISAADPSHVWAAGEDRSNATGQTVLYSSDNAGATWHRIDLSALQ